MDVYRTEEEQVAALQRWWRENYKPVIAAVVLAVASYGGWKWYQHTQQEKANAAAALYETMMTSAQEIVTAGPGAADALVRMQRAGDALVSEHAGSVYAQFGALLLAGNAAEVDDLAGAEKYLRSALSVDAGTGSKVIIENRLARVLSAQGKHDEALAAISGAVPEALVAAREETRGDVLLAQGKRGEARAAYEKAKVAAGDDEAALGFLPMKLDYVAGE
jgi:predicted negative regulator of RcsB-dependent stress response